MNLRTPITAKFNYFFYSILTICSAYLIYEFIYIPYWALAADEFVFAKHIAEYTNQIPYKDFSPYKTVLGYYLLSIPYFFSNTLLQPLFYIKDEIAIINTLCLAGTAYWGSRFFNKKAVLLSLLAIIANQLFLMYATDLRVDMLTSWFCLFAALSILDNRSLLGGALIGTAFLISQKALWAIVAINGGIGVCWLAFNSTQYSWKSIFRFNLSALAIIAAYIFFWAALTDFHTVISNLFYEAYIQAGIDWYAPIYVQCWIAVLKRGPMLFLLWPLTFCSLLKEYQDTAQIQRRIFIFSFSTLSLLMLINYKQAFPYNFVFAIPAFFLLYADFCDWLLSTNNQIKSNPFTHVGSWLYAGIIFTTIYLLDLSGLYYAAVLIPLFIGGSIQLNKSLAVDVALKIRLTLGIFLLTAVALPLIESFKTSAAIDGNYQKQILSITADLLDDGDGYIAGIPYFYNKSQPIPGMENLIGPAIDYLYQPTDKLAPLLLPSLYLTPTSVQQILQDLETQPVKVILDNYRIKYLPLPIINYINKNYQQYAGSIYLYAPQVSHKQLTFNLKFAGNYKITANKTFKVKIDRKLSQVGDMVALQKGDHISDALFNYRLVLVPKKVSTTELSSPRDEWMNMLKAIVA